MKSQDEEKILNNAYDFFVNFFNDKSQAYERKKINAFKINPFTIQATAKALNNKIDAKSMAEAIVYPFALGTSISTSFGTRLQEFIVTTMGNSINGSAVTGMDIEYTDAIDNRKKYCQLKSGPNTINRDDVDTIEQHFKNLSNLARVNHLSINTNDRIVGVLYGSHDDLSGMYQRLEKDGITVLAGQKFWYHLTGSKSMYADLIATAQKAAQASQMNNNLNNLIQKMTDKINENPTEFGIKK